MWNKGKENMKRWVLLLACVLLFSAGCAVTAQEGVSDADVQERFADASEPMATGEPDPLPPADEDETPPDYTGVRMHMDSPVHVGDEWVTFRIENGSEEDFSYGYTDISFWKKVNGSYQAVPFEGWFTTIAVLISAGTTGTQRVQPEKYGVTLQAGDTYRIELRYDQEFTFYTEDFTVEG